MLPSCKSSLVLSSIWHAAKRMVFTNVLEILSSTERPVKACAGNNDVRFAQFSFSVYPQLELLPKGVFHCWLPSLLFWPIKLFIPLLWISVVGVGIWKKISSGRWPKSLTRNQGLWQAWLLIISIDHQGGNKESQGNAFFKHLWVPSHQTWSASSEQAHVKQVHGLALHWGLSAKPGNAQASLTSLPCLALQPSRNWISTMEKTTAGAVETCMCVIAQLKPWEERLL